MSYEDAREFFDPGLYLPIGKKRYRVESPTAREGLRLRLLLLQGPRLDDATETAEVQKLMGDTIDEMRADGVKWPEIAHAGRTALLHFGVSPAVAVKNWGGEEDPGNPLPPDPNPGANVYAEVNAAVP